MAPIKIAVACQGGGNQTAFTAGALKALLGATRDDETFEVVSLSGTSGGALCATLAWYAHVKRATPRWRPLMAAATAGQRRGGSDLRAVLESHVDFAEIATWGARAQRPVLMLGAANVTTGHLAKFVSSHEPIRVEHVLASCAAPNVLPAVQIGGHAYREGLFSDNPPVDELVRPRTVGVDNVPDEIWVIKINPTKPPRGQVEPGEGLDRGDALEGNLSLFQQLAHLEWLNDLIARDAFRPGFLAALDVRAPIRIPKAFELDPEKPHHIPCIELTPELQATLDGDGDGGDLDQLIAAGEAAARSFLERRALAVASPAPPPPPPGPW